MHIYAPQKEKITVAMNEADILDEIVGILDDEMLSNGCQTLDNIGTVSITNVQDGGTSPIFY